MVGEGAVRNNQIRIFFILLGRRDSQLDWVWGERERKKSRITTRFLAGTTGSIVAPFTNVGRNGGGDRFWSG